MPLLDTPQEVISLSLSHKLSYTSALSFLTSNSLSSTHSHSLTLSLSTAHPAISNNSTVSLSNWVFSASQLRAPDANDLYRFSFLSTFLFIDSLIPFSSDNNFAIEISFLSAMGTRRQ